MKIKDFTSSIEDIQGRTVKTVWSATSIKDLDGDVIADNAFTKTINERFKGSNLIYSLIDHKASLQTCLGKPKELYVEGQKLYAVTDIVDTTLGNDMLEHYKAGTINQHSIGFSVPNGKQMQREGYNEILEVKLYEGSAVLWGANPNTPTVGIKSLSLEDTKKKSEDLFSELTRLCKLLKKGNLTDEGFELLEITIAQRKSEYELLFESIFEKQNANTQPSVTDTKPFIEGQKSTSKINFDVILNSLM